MAASGFAALLRPGTVLILLEGSSICHQAQHSRLIRCSLVLFSGVFISKICFVLSPLTLFLFWIRMLATLQLALLVFSIEDVLDV